MQFQKIYLLVPGPPNFADVSIFLQKISVFCPKKYLYSKQYCESCVIDFIVLFSVFLIEKVTINGKVTFEDFVSGIWPPDCSKLAKNPKNNNDVTIFRHDVIVKFFWRCFVSLVKFSYWSKFHVNIVTGSGIMTILFYKRLTKNPEIGNTPVWVLPNIWRRGWVMDTKFGTNVSKEYYWMLQHARGYRFYRFWVIKGKPTGAGG